MVIPNTPQSAAMHPMQQNKSLTEIIEVITPTNKDEIAVVPTTPKCTIENSRP